MEACQKAGIARSTGQKYLKSVTFRRAFREYRSELLRQTTTQLQTASLEAVQILRGIMLDDTVSPYARQQAAQTILTTAYKAHGIESVHEVLEEYEMRFSELSGSE